MTKVYSPKIIIVQHQGTGVHFSMELTHAQTNYCLFSYQYIKIIFNSYIITTYLHEVYFQSIVTYSTLTSRYIGFKLIRLILLAIWSIVKTFFEVINDIHYNV